MGKKVRWGRKPKKGSHTVTDSTGVRPGEQQVRDVMYSLVMAIPENNAKLPDRISPPNEWILLDNSDLTLWSELSTVKTLRKEPKYDVILGKPTGCVSIGPTVLVEWLAATFALAGTVEDLAALMLGRVVNTHEAQMLGGKWVVVMLQWHKGQIKLESMELPKNHWYGILPCEWCTKWLTCEFVDPSFQFKFVESITSIKHEEPRFLSQVLSDLQLDCLVPVLHIIQSFFLLPMTHHFNPEKL